MLQTPPQGQNAQTVPKDSSVLCLLVPWLESFALRYRGNKAV